MRRSLVTFTTVSYVLCITSAIKIISISDIHLDLNYNSLSTSACAGDKEDSPVDPV